MQVRLAEEQARQLAGVITAVLADLGHDPADEGVRKAVRLRLLEEGARNEDQKEDVVVALEGSDLLAQLAGRNGVDAV